MQIAIFDRGLILFLFCLVMSVFATNNFFLSDEEFATNNFLHSNKINKEMLPSEFLSE